MNKFEFNFKCLDGHYNLLVDLDTGVYAIDSDMPNFTSTNNVLSNTKEFIDLINKSKPQTWCKNETNTIEDSTQTLISYHKDNHEYVCAYYESHEPFAYEYIIKVLALLEPNASFFLV